MVCPSCGSPFGTEAEARFCPKCGTAIPGSSASSGPPPTSGPPYPAGYPVPLIPDRRVSRNLQILGLLWCIFGAYRVIAGLVGMLFLRAFAMHGYGHGWFMHGGMPPHLPPGMLAVIIPFVATYTIVTAALSIFVGYSLLTRRSWARVLSIVVAVLALLKFPLGTALGIYTLYVMAPAASGLEYDTIASGPYAA